MEYVCSLILHLANRFVVLFSQAFIIKTSYYNKSASVILQLSKPYNRTVLKLHASLELSKLNENGLCFLLSSFNIFFGASIFTVILMIDPKYVNSSTPLWVRHLVGVALCSCY